MLKGIDIASHQEGIDVSRVDADFVIVKVCGGTSYVNDRAHGAWRDWRDIANDVLKSGKLLGLYGYACEYDSEPGGKAEAEFFLKQIKGFEGKAVLCLDWEAHAQSMPVSYAKAWLDTVAKATGATPMFYGYASYINSRDHSAIAKYPLWMASYLDRYSWGSGYVDNPANTWETGSWPKMTMYQYSSTRFVKGYSERLDVNVFYGTRADWLKLAGASKAKQEAAKPAPKISRAEDMVRRAVAIAEDDSHGYSQVRRWPTQGSDFDCSSLILQCAHDAGYKVPTGYGYTGTMLADFKAAGFKAIRFTGLSNLKRGDILLNVENHTELCIGGGKFVGAHIAETGGIDGQPGDQTGNEISICKAYVYSEGWDWVLRPPEDAEEAEQEPQDVNPDAVRYKVSTDPNGKLWYDEMRDGFDTGWSGDDYAGAMGVPIRWLACDAKKYRVFTERSGWLPWVKRYDSGDLNKGCAGDGSPILGVEIADDTVIHAAHVAHGWYSEMRGRKQVDGKCKDTFAGDLANPVDAVRMRRA